MIMLRVDFVKEKDKRRYLESKTDMQTTFEVQTYVYVCFLD